MIVTGLGLIAGALEDLAIIGAGRDPSPREVDSGLAALNQMADAHGLDKSLLYAVERVEVPLVIGQASYTLGTDGEIDVERPDWIDEANLIRDSSSDNPDEQAVRVLDRHQWARWPRKDEEQQYVRAVYFEKGLATSTCGVLYVLPVPTISTTTLVLYMPAGYLAEFDLSTNVAVPRGWSRMLQKNLAIELAPKFPMAVVSRELAWAAKTSLQAIKNANIRIPEQKNDPALVGCRGVFDIDTGMYRV